MTAAIQIFFKCLKSPIYYSVDDHASYFIGVNNYHQVGNALSSYDEMHQPIHTLCQWCAGKMFHKQEAWKIKALICIICWFPWWKYLCQAVWQCSSEEVHIIYSHEQRVLPFCYFDKDVLSKANSSTLVLDPIPPYFLKTSLTDKRLSSKSSIYLLIFLEEISSQYLSWYV